MQYLHVVAAAVFNQDEEILITRRSARAHQGGLWEFPGGKVESGESPRKAIARELEEELGILPLECRRQITIRHQYPDRWVFLDVWRVKTYTGEPHGRQGQPVLWVSADNLVRYRFPAANLPIITALRLPSRYLITPEVDRETDQFLDCLRLSLEGGIRLVQLRAKLLGQNALMGFAKGALDLCHQYGAQMILNSDLETFLRLEADGIHLTSQRLMHCALRPVPSDIWFSASVHNRAQLTRAQELGVDCAVIAPVKRTLSHPRAEPIGWKNFSELADRADFPVYALGGMEENDRGWAFEMGAQGIAATRALWGC